jgi:hypothetical protein
MSEELERLYQLYLLDNKMEKQYLHMCERQGVTPKDVAPFIWNKFRLRNHHRYHQLFFNDVSFTYVKKLHYDLTLFPISDLTELEINHRDVVVLRTINGSYVKSIKVSTDSVISTEGIRAFQQISFPNLETLDFRDLVHYGSILSWLREVMNLNLPKLSNITISPQFLRAICVDAQRIDLIERAKGIIKDRFRHYTEKQFPIADLLKRYPTLAINGKRKLPEEPILTFLLKV